MTTTIATLYEELQPNIQPAHKWLFSMSMERKIKEPYPVLVAWVDNVQRLCPEKNKELSILMGLKPHNKWDI